ncbi:xanthine dehydrogenase family protein molybdopterin-binding subunit [Sphingomonas sp.]|uniref:xanthine dehydrogenase family protein molybdopterin-binding subunit n=1 Tax=Sphingomonas sp. TaxID=28214 RepID=UPI003B00DF56
MATQPASPTSRIGDPLSRVDGRLKTTGRAPYAADFPVEGLTYGVVVSSEIARGRIVSIDAGTAEAQPGVIAVLTHEKRPDFVAANKAWNDQVAPNGEHFKPLLDAAVAFSQQPVAVVVAETFEAARAAARMVKIAYDAETPMTDIAANGNEAYHPGKTGPYKPVPSRGDAVGAYRKAPVKVYGAYTIATEHHNAMEPHAATAIWQADGSLLVHDKTQGAQNPQAWLAGIFGLKTAQVRVVAPYMGGGFGGGLRPQYQLFLAALSAKAVGRPVKIVLARQQTFSLQYRPQVIYDIALGADAEGHLQAIKSECLGVTSRFEENAEAVADWGPRVYRCDNALINYKITPLDTYTPGPMRAPGAATAMNLFEIAMDELAYEVGIDPLELRLRNYSTKDEIEDKEYTSKALRAAYNQGADAFGWARRSQEPRSMREGRELVGWGMATGAWETLYQPHTLRAKLHADGRLEVATASADIGTGTYTIMTQVASEEMGLPVDRIDARLGDSDLPKAPVEGGSWGAASITTALQIACRSLKAKLVAAAARMEFDPLDSPKLDQVEFAGGLVRRIDDPTRVVAVEDIVRASGTDAIGVEERPPAKLVQSDKAKLTHQAVFAEVKVDEELGQVRVTRVTAAVAAGRIINPKTARSQILGGVVMGIGMALHEETMIDHRLGRYMNHNLAEYHVPAHADIYDIEVIFVDEPDREVNPVGIKGLGEIGIVGTAAAVANAIFHATGKRQRDLPITIDKLL